jgi:uncharacterized protein (DUF1697 family)
MPQFIALLRAVNVAGHGKVGMADLRALGEGLGLKNVRTLLQSGNLVFEAQAKPEALETKLAAAAKKELGLATTFFVRSADAWAKLVAANPFPDAAKKDPSHLVLLALKDAPAKAAVEALRAEIAKRKGREQVAAKGAALYAVYPDGIGRSKLTNALIEKTLGTEATGRNWNTVLKLAAVEKISPSFRRCRRRRPR